MWEGIIPFVIGAVFTWISVIIGAAVSTKSDRDKEKDPNG